MKQVLRKGLKHIVVDEVPDPAPTPHHVLVRPMYSLISAGTEAASIHKESLLSSVAENPSHLRKIYDAMKVAGPVRTAAEVQAKFSEYAALGYSGAGYVVDRHPSVTDLEVGTRVAYGGEGTGHAETVLAGRLLVARIPDDVSFEEACFTTLGAIAMILDRQEGRHDADHDRIRLEAKLSDPRLPNVFTRSLEGCLVDEVRNHHHAITCEPIIALQ